MALLADFIDEFGGPGTPLTVGVIQLGANMRINEDEKLEIKNADTLAWHEVRPRGADGEEEFEIKTATPEL